MKPLTVGEVFDRQGPCALMAQVVRLAETCGRVPVGEWDYVFVSDPDWRLIVNGGAAAEWQPAGAFAPVKRFTAALEYRGWLRAQFNTVEGVVIGASEPPLLAALEREYIALIRRGESDRGEEAEK